MLRKPLKDDEIAGLMAVCDACNGSPSAHVPIEFICRKLSRPYRDEAKGIIEKIARHPERLILAHKGRTKSYSITMAGIEELRRLGLIP